MANLLQQRALDAVVREYAVKHALEHRKAFLPLVIEKYLPELDLNDIDIETSIVDGYDDCGIDAIVIDDDDPTDRPTIYFFQSKYFEKENAFECNLDGTAVEKIQAGVNDFVLHGRINPKYQNSRLIDRLRSVHNLGARNPKYLIVLCSNSAPPSEAAKARLDDFIRDTNRSAGGEYLLAVYLHLDRIAQELIAPQQKVRIDTDLQVSGKYLTEDTGNVRLFVGAVEGNEVARLVKDHGDAIFERNVRGYLRSSNSVNQGIVETATGPRSPYFVYMNNGVTITCDRFEHAPINNSPRLRLENAQIVNGQQTARSIHKAQQSEKLKGDVKVLVRIVETRNPDLLGPIIEATNSQTKVTSRDLHSNDPVQKLIEESLASQGFFYEAKKDKYAGKETSKRVDAEVAAQAFYAVFSKKPAVAKDKKKILFGELYDDLFNVNTNPADILYGFRLLKNVQALNKLEEWRQKYSFLTDATLHIASLIAEYSERTQGRLPGIDDPKEIQGLYAIALEVLAALVKERSEEEGDKYEHRRTFADSATYGRSIEIMNRKIAHT